MKPRIAIPVPHSKKRDYVQRALPQYQRAIQDAGAEAVVVPLEASPEEVARLITGCHAVLLPGSPADVDPQKYGAARHPKTAPADPSRDDVDELLLQDAYNLRKPILGICYGLQSLNVWRSGTLVQHLGTRVDHEAKAASAHKVEIFGDSMLAEVVSPSDLPSLVPGDETSEGHAAVEQHAPVEIMTNSSHHQAADRIGDGLRVAGRCPDDGTVEAIEGTAPQHFVLAVQWHPERSYERDPASRAIFRALVEAARSRR